MCLRMKQTPPSNHDHRIDHGPHYWLLGLSMQFLCDNNEYLVLVGRRSFEMAVELGGRITIVLRHRLAMTRWKPGHAVRDHQVLLI